MNKLLIEEFVDRFNFYRKAHRETTSIERTLEDLRIKHNLRPSEVEEIREYFLDMLEADE